VAENDENMRLDESHPIVHVLPKVLLGKPVSFILQSLNLRKETFFTKKILSTTAHDIHSYPIQSQSNLNILST
jgi:hypothetical protein